MSENTNIVKNWAQNILHDAETILGQLSGGSAGKTNIAIATKAAGEIKGNCEAIITAMVATEDHRCPTCANASVRASEYPCNTCKYKNVFQKNDMWREK